MLGELISWWAEQMREFVAPLAQRLSRRSGDALLVDCAGGADGPWRLIHRRNGTAAAVATIPRDASPSVWRDAFAARPRAERTIVSLGRPFLVRRTSLPVAAMANIDNLLRFEMDRLTPFQAGDVLFTHRIVSRDAAAGRLLVDVAVLPKTWIGAILERLARLSIRPDAVEEIAHPMPPAKRRAASAEPWQIALDHHDPVRRARVRLACRTAVVICVLLLFAVIATPFVRQSLALAATAEQLEQLRPRMDRVDTLRRQIASASYGAGRIAAARQQSTIALRVLADLTDVLGDDTYLTSLSLHQTRVTIEGRSSAATKLIAAIAADPRLNNPSFGAPVVRAGNDMDVFTIQVGFGS